jgi:single-strand DNA-binding protein
MINNVVIMGRLTKEPEERKTSTGKTVCSICVAVDNRFDKEKTDFFDVIAWNQTAEFICKHFHKGTMIAVQGRLATRMWEDKNGSKHKAVEIVADNVSFCGGKNESNTGSIDVPPPTDAEYKDIPDTDEELPF